MTCTSPIRMFAVCVLFGAACLAPVPTIAQTGVDKGCSPTLDNPCTGSTSGGGTTSPLSPALQDAASQLGAALGVGLRKALFGDPAADARRAELFRRQQEAARLRHVEEERQREAVFQRLSANLKLSGLSTLSLKGFDGDNGALTLKGVAITQSQDGNPLGLKLGDDASKDDGLRPRGTLAFEESRTPKSPLTTEPNTDPMVVDLRDVQQSAFLVQSAETVSPDDAAPLLDEALRAANGDKSVIALVPAGFTIPAIDGAGLLAFQTANADYRKANDSRMHLSEIFSLAQQRREQADRLAEAAIAEMEQAKAGLADETTLKRKHELLSAIFAAAKARDEAFAKATADIETARAKKYLAGEEAIRVLRAVTTGKAPANFHPPVPSLVDLDETTWTQVQNKLTAGRQELERQGEEIRSALARMKPQLPVKYERMREGVILGADTDKGDARAMTSVTSPFTNKTPLQMNEFAEKAKKGGIDDVGGALVVSFGTTKTGSPGQQAIEATRVVGDHLTDGLVSLRTAEGRKAIETLSGKSFDRLIAHSNGSPIAEALIEADLIKVNELNIVGGDRSLLNGHALQRLLDEGKVKRVVVWINVNDPVVWLSSADQLKLRQRSGNALEHLARKISGDLAGGDSRVQFRFMRGDAAGDDPWKQHRIDTAYYTNIAKYFQNQ